MSRIDRAFRRAFRAAAERLRSLFRKGQVEAELDEELRFHLERQVEKNVGAGMDPAEARRRAHIEFGSVEAVKEQHRDARGTRYLEDLVQDLRFALRNLRRQPAMSVVALSTLAVGIGAVTAIFSVFNGVLFEPLPFEEPERLISIWGRFDPESGYDFPFFPLSNPEYVDYREQSRAMEDVAAYTTSRATVTSGIGDPERVPVAAVSANLFEVLRVEPALGRGFTQEEDLPGGPGVVVLDHGYWDSRFGGDPAIVGSAVTVDGQPVDVVGVMPPGFGFPDDDIAMWTPIRIDPADPGNRQSHQIRAIGRLAPGVGLPEAEAELDTLMAAWKAEYPEIHTGHYLRIRPRLDDIVGDLRPALILLLGAAGFVLLIVCANVASIMLARGEERGREVAVRTALGAGRERVVRLLVTESLTLSVLGGALGVGLAHAAVRALVSLDSGSIPRAHAVGIDAEVLVFSVVVAALAGLVSGLVPAVHASSCDIRSLLVEGGRGATMGSGRRRFRRALVVAQVALSFALLVGAALMLRSFGRLLEVDAGFETEDVLAARLSTPSASYADDADVHAFYRQLEERVRALPGVAEVGIGNSLPLVNGPGNWDFVIEGRPEPGPGEVAWSASFTVVRPGFFETLGLELLAGRFVRPSDGPDAAPVTIISETMARRFFAGEDPLGKRISVDGLDDAAWMTIVGVVGDVRWDGLDVPAEPIYYTPHEQTRAIFHGVARSMYVLVRGEVDPLALIDPLRSIVRQLDPEMPLAEVQTMETVVERSVAQDRFTSVLLAIFAAVAVFLGASGVYGVLAHSVAQRSHEIGIRLTLGARPGGIVRMIVAEGMLPVAVGIGVGIAASVWLGGALSSLLFEISPLDVGTYVAVTAALCLVAIAACSVPALRAVRVDPAETLRAE